MIKELKHKQESEQIQLLRNEAKRIELTGRVLYRQILVLKNTYAKNSMARGKGYKMWLKSGIKLQEMKEEYKKNIFDPLYKIELRIKNIREGLNISNDILKDHLGIEYELFNIKTCI